MSGRAEFYGGDQIYVNRFESLTYFFFKLQNLRFVNKSFHNKVKLAFYNLNKLCTNNNIFFELE